MTRTIALHAALFAALLPPAAAAQVRDATGAPSASTALGAIVGVVVAAENPSTPVRRAIVTVTSGALGSARSVVSDDNGAFAFERLPPGEFTIIVTKPAYIANTFGAKTWGGAGTPVAVKAGQRVQDIRIPLARGGVIAGVLRNEKGAAVKGIQVMALKNGEALNSRSLISSPLANDNGLTDERGAYRLYGLPPGDYVVVALPTLRGGNELHRRTTADVDAMLRGTPPAPAASQAWALSPIFFPGTPMMDNAANVAITPGSVREDIDFMLSYVPSASIEGTIVRPADSTAPLILMIIGAGQRQPLVMSMAPRLAIAPGPDGHFKFVNAAPGRYTVSVTMNRPNDPASGKTGTSLYWASADVDVNGTDISDVSLILQPPMTMSGRVAFDSASGTPPSDASRVELLLSPPAGIGGTGMTNSTNYGGLLRPVSSRVNADGTFTLPNITPGTYRLNLPPSSQVLSGWWLRSAMYEGRDLLDGPLTVAAGVDLPGVVITFTDRHTEVGGMLQTPAGLAATDYSVIVFPADRALRVNGSRRIRSTRPASDGQYRFTDLPPGDYVVAALTDVDMKDLGDAAFLESVASAGLKLTLSEGEKKKQDLRLAK